MTVRTQLSVPLGATTRPRAPGTVDAAGRCLIDVRTESPVTRELLDALGLPGWLIVVAVRERDGVAVEAVEPLDEYLWRLHQPPVEPSP